MGATLWELAGGAPAATHFLYFASDLNGRTQDANKVSRHVSNLDTILPCAGGADHVVGGLRIGKEMDSLTKRERSERMSRIKGADTKPELIVRRVVHGMGFRYRLHDCRLPGRPDLVFAARKKIIFVHGCFWHRHEDEHCKLARLPKSRLDFWLPKLAANSERDRRVLLQLQQLGWSVLVIWECELQDKEALANRIKTFLEELGA